MSPHLADADESPTERLKQPCHFRLRHPLVPAAGAHLVNIGRRGAVHNAHVPAGDRGRDRDRERERDRDQDTATRTGARATATATGAANATTAVTVAGMACGHECRLQWGSGLLWCDRIGYD